MKEGVEESDDDECEDDWEPTQDSEASFEDEDEDDILTDEDDVHELLNYAYVVSG